MEAVWPLEGQGSSAAFREPGGTDARRGSVVKNNSTLLSFHNVVIEGKVSAAAVSQEAGARPGTGNATVLVHTGLRPSVLQAIKRY